MIRFLRALLIITLIAFFAPSSADAQSVSFTATSTRGCETVVSLFSPTVTGCSGSVSYTWFFRHTTAGILDSNISGIYTFDSIGTYDVWVRATCGGSVFYDTMFNYITVDPPPTISFSTTNPSRDTNISCGPLTVNFINTTTSDTSCAHTWTWVITGPGTSYIANGSTTSYTFSTPGRYTVYLLYLAGSCFCFGSVQQVDYIKIDSPTTACFTSPGRAAGYCDPPVTINYDASCSRNVGRYEWHFGNGVVRSTSGATTANTYSTRGSFSDTLITFSPGGCRSDTVLRNNVNIGTFTAALAHMPDTICQGAVFTIADSTTVGTPTSYNFRIFHVGTGTFIDSFTSSSRTAAFSYPPPYDNGSYIIIDSVTNAFGCTSGISKRIFVRSNPRITSMVADSIFKCTAPMTVHFTSTVTPGSAALYRYTWSFGAGSSATTGGSGVSSATYTYTASGSYSPRLTITDRFGCSDDTALANVVNITPPRVRINTLIDSGCAPLPLRYTVDLVSPAGLSLMVDSVTFGDTLHQPCIGSTCSDSVYTYTYGGTFTVKAYWHLSDTFGGCSGMDTTTVLIGNDRPLGGGLFSSLNDTFLISADTICVNTQVYFHDSCTNCTASRWTIRTPFGTYDTSGATTNVYYGSGGGDNPGPNWPVTLIRSVRGCTDTLTDTIFVRSPKRGNIIGPFHLGSCANWDSVRLTLQGGSDSSTQTWRIYGPSDSVRRVTTPPLFGTFTSTTGRAGIGATSSVILDANHRRGWYRIMVTSSGTRFGGCSDTVSRWIRIDSTNADSFRITNTTPCRRDLVRFIGPVAYDSLSPTSPAETYAAYEWFWGDGTSTFVTAGDTYNLSFKDTSHSYTLPGVYTVTLVVTNSFSCAETLATRRVTVYGPAGNFGVSTRDICLGDAVTFTDNNRPNPSGTSITSRRWYLNYGSDTAFTPTSTPTLTTIYSATGTYNVRLLVTDNRGCTNDTSWTVRVSKPVAGFVTSDTPNHICPGYAVSFFSTTRAGYNYSWNFGDGTGWTSFSRTAYDTTYAYRTDGRYTVSLIISSYDSTTGFPNGCMDTAVRNNYIVVRSSRYTSTNYGDPLTVTCPPIRLVRFTDTPGGIPRDYVNYTWTVTSGLGTSTFSGPLLNTSINTSGAIQVVLTGTTILGCVDTEVTNYFVGGPAGYITLSTDSGCVPVRTTMRFVDTGTVSASSRYIWTTCPFGSFITTRPDTTLDYNTVGSFCRPSLVITSGACAVTIVGADSVRVFPYPNLTVTPDPLPVLCYGTSGVLTVNADTTAPVTSYNWAPSTFISCTTCQTVIVNPLVTTTYTVSGSTVHGCADTAYSVVRVDSPLQILFRGKPRVCIGNCDTIIAYGVRGGLYAWQGVGISCAVCDTNIICINQTRTFTVTATNPDGCQVTDSVKVIIDPLPVLTVSPDPAYVCKYSDPTLLTVSGADRYQWRPFLGLSCDTCGSTYTNIQTNIVYTVVGTTRFGCKDSINFPVVVYDTTVTAAGTDTSICFGSQTRLFASGGVAFLWSPAGSLDNPTSSTPWANPTTTTVYTVIITENVCFKDTLNVTVKVVPIPTIQVSGSAEIVAGNSVQLSVVSTNETMLRNFIWLPSDTTLSCFTCPRPMASPITTTIYTVTASTIEGCAATGTVTVRVKCQEDQVFIPNTFTPNGDGLNDRFYISGKGLGNIKRLAVFNRWGELIFEANNVRSNDPASGWDGTYKGEILPPDVFMYLAEVECSNGETFKYKGDISIVR